jgi:ribosomal protein S18 acetylase RimI-like enzyme
LGKEFAISYGNVNGKYQRGGIHAQMLTEAIAIAKKRGADQVFLVVEETNLKSFGSCKKAGFVPVRRYQLIHDPAKPWAIELVYDFEKEKSIKK